MHMSSKTDHHDAGRQAKRTNMPPLTFTWPLIIALSACGGGGGGSGTKPTTSNFKEVRDTVGDVRDGLVRIGGSIIKKPVDRDNQSEGNAPTEPPNDRPVRVFDNPNFINEIGTENQKALTVGHEFSYQFNPTTFIDPEGGPITLSLQAGSNLPPGLRFDASTGMISGKVLPIDNLGINGRLFKITIVGTDNQGLMNTDGILFQVIPNAAPELKKDIDDISYVIGEDAEKILINFNEYFTDPDGDKLSFTVDKVPPGMKMTATGQYLYDRPTEAFDDVITVTARDTVSGKTETSQFRLTVSISNAESVTGSDNAFTDQTTGESVDHLIPANDIDVTVHDLM